MFILQGLISSFSLLHIDGRENFQIVKKTLVKLATWADLDFVYRSTVLPFNEIFAVDPDFNANKNFLFK